MSFIKKDYVKDFVVRLTVSRPEALNALNIDVIQGLKDSVGAERKDYLVLLDMELLMR